MSIEDCESHNKVAEPTLAQRQAAGLWDVNLRALAVAQPDLAEQLGRAPEPPVAWVFGRDGSLTARRRIDGSWWGGSSLPLEVGRSLMKSLEVAGRVGCLLAPASAGQIRVALERSGPAQALIVVLPDLDDVLVALRCQDFSMPIAAGRMWLVCGRQWEGQLTELLEAQPGLCIPQMYIRTHLLAEADLAQMIAATNPIFSAQTSRRAQKVAELRRQWVPKPRGRVCVLAGCTFSLEGFAAAALGEVLGENETFTRLETDRPTSASSLAIGLALEDCSAVVAADVYRADMDDVAADQLAWITWVTQPRLAAPTPAAPNDALLLADPAWRKEALALGWRRDRVAAAAWPTLVEASPVPPGGPLALIGDAPLSPIPRKLKDFSSHAVLWEQIAAELADDPLSVGGDIDAYLSSRMARQEIQGQSLNRELFKQQLILPAWRRGVARRLLKAGLPLILFGTGWEEGEEFTARWKGPISTLQELRRAARLAGALVHPSPAAQAHPIHALNRPVLRAVRGGRGIAPVPATAASSRLSSSAVLSLLSKPGEN